MTAEFDTGLLKTQPKLMGSSLFQSFQAFFPSTLNVQEAILSDSRAIHQGDSCGEPQDSIYCHNTAPA